MNKYIHPLQHSFFPNQKVTTPVKKESKQTFKQVLTDVTNVKVSKHAKMRLQEREIHINNEKWQQISEKMNEAKAKGVTDALVVMDEVALVVSTKNNTVVTALHHKEAADKIFTNINGTIIM